MVGEVRKEEKGVISPGRDPFLEGTGDVAGVNWKCCKRVMAAIARFGDDLLRIVDNILGF